MKYTVKDQSTKIHKLETSLAQTQEEKEALGRQSKDLKTKVNELLAVNEKLERELFIKRRVLDEFEAKKKMETVVLKERLKVQKMTLTY